VRRAALADLALDPAFADAQLEAVHGGVLGQREHVDSFDPVGGSVVERLHHARPGDHARDTEGDVRGQQRRARRVPAVQTLEQQRSCGALRGLGASGEQQHRGDQNDRGGKRDRCGKRDAGDQVEGDEAGIGGRVGILHGSIERPLPGGEPQVCGKAGEEFWQSRGRRRHGPRDGL